MDNQRFIPHRIIKISNFITIILVTLLIYSCTSGGYYSDYKRIPHSGWNKDSAVHFQVPVDDTVTHFEVIVNIRHYSNYPYQNCWLFMTEKAPNGQISNDTIGCYLADDRGKWLGSGLSSIYTMPVLWHKDKRFSRKGTYTFSIVQGMRDDILSGISDIGMEINKSQ